MTHSVFAQHLSGRCIARAAVLALLLLFFGSNVTPVVAQYTRTDLATTANDPQHLINSWGLTALPASPFWLSDNGTGFSTLYTGGGAQIPLFVTIPPSANSPAGSAGTPTGTVGNIGPNSADFTVTENGNSGKSLFIFVTQDGTISAWNPVVDGITVDPKTGNRFSHATIMADQIMGQVPQGATYTGLAIATNTKGLTFLYATDGGPNRDVDVFRSDFSHLGSFSDPAIPKDFTTYAIQAINRHIWVTFTPLNKAQGGFVDVFDINDDGSLTLARHNALHGPLHSPWGIAKAPADFGPMSNTILISNNTSHGRINAFDPNTGVFLGPLLENGNPIEIDNVWAIQFGQDGGPNGMHNQLFFTGGPNGYSNGIFGVVSFGH